MTDEWNPDPRGAASRLQGARKQIHLAREEIDDEELVGELQEAIDIVEGVQTRVSFTNDDTD